MSAEKFYLLTETQLIKRDASNLLRGSKNKKAESLPKPLRFISDAEIEKLLPDEKGDNGRDFYSQRIGAKKLRNKILGQVSWIYKT